MAAHSCRVRGEVTKFWKFLGKNTIFSEQTVAREQLLQNGTNIELYHYVEFKFYNVVYATIPYALLDSVLGRIVFHIDRKKEYP